VPACYFIEEYSYNHRISKIVCQIENLSILYRCRPAGACFLGNILFYRNVAPTGLKKKDGAARSDEDIKVRVGIRRSLLQNRLAIAGDRSDRKLYRSRGEVGNLIRMGLRGAVENRT